MTKEEILRHVDHTLLKQEATWEDVHRVCEEAIAVNAASVCIAPVFVKKAAEFCQGRVAVCTVIGFPNGYHTTETKVFEAQEAVSHGADEIDMVINIGWVKAGRYEAILNEINAVKEACAGKILKVIVETCLLTEEEKVHLCKLVGRSKADYIKTSTGFAGGGATEQDIALFAKHVEDGAKIKASGGIRTFEDAQKYILLGADRIGSSGLAGQYLQEKQN